MSLTEHESNYRYREQKSPIGVIGRFARYRSHQWVCQLFFGADELFGALCFKYPEYLTTKELRDVYDPYVLQDVLKWAMWTATALGVYTFVQGRRRRLGAIGLAGTLLAFALGGYTIDPRAVTPTQMSLGLDWFLLDLLISAAVFVCIEKMWPKYKEQAVLRPEWRTDLIYFGVNHLLIAILLLAANGFAPKFFGWAVNDDLRNFMHSLPIWGQALMMALCADFVLYWSHRLFQGALLVEISCRAPLHRAYGLACWFAQSSGANVCGPVRSDGTAVSFRRSERSPRCLCDSGCFPSGLRSRQCGFALRTAQVHNRDTTVSPLAPQLRKTSYRHQLCRSFSAVRLSVQNGTYAHHELARRIRHHQTAPPHVLASSPLPVQKNQVRVMASARVENIKLRPYLLYGKARRRGALFGGCDRERYPPIDRRRHRCHRLVGCGPWRCSPHRSRPSKTHRWLFWWGVHSPSWERG